MYERYLEQQQEISPESWDKAVRAVVPARYRRLAPVQLERFLRQSLAEMSLQEREVVVESLGKIAKDIGLGLSKNAGTIGTVGGAALGTVLLGPAAGTAIGGALGGALGTAIGGATAPQSQARGGTRRTSQMPAGPSTRSPTGATAYARSGPQVPAPQPLTGSPPIAGSPANQLMVLVNNPHFLIQMLRTMFAATRMPGPQSRGELVDSLQVAEYANAVRSIANELSVHTAESSQTAADYVERLSEYSSDIDAAGRVLEYAYTERENLRRQSANY